MKAAFWIRVIDLPFVARTRVVGEMIGGALGKCLEARMGREGRSNGDSFQLKVLIDISKPLRQGVILNVEGNPKP